MPAPAPGCNPATPRPVGKAPPPTKSRSAARPLHPHRHPQRRSPAPAIRILSAVEHQVAVRRTRRFVKHYYVGDKVVINGVEQEIRFPTPRVRRMDYDLDAALPGMFDMLATALGAHVLETRGDGEAVLLDAPGEVLSLARYVPSRFRVGTDAEEQYEQQNAGLLRSILLKRFESSAYAFRRTVEKMITSHDQFVSALDAGRVLTGDALREWSSSDVDDMDEFLGAYAGDADNIRDANDYRVDELRAAVIADRDLLHRLHDSVQILAWDKDPKLVALTDALASIAADAAAEGITDQQVRDKRKVIIFSYYADTVEHLATQVRAAVEADDRLAAYRDRIATAAGPDKHGRAQTLAGFAPRTAGGEHAEDLYDLLIATDVLSEGVNLQQARHIVNYDLPWNPMRLVQRHGRIDRIGSEHAEVFIRCYFPDQHLEALLGLEERLQRKLKQAAAAVGVGQVLPGFAGRDVIFTETVTRSTGCAAKMPLSSRKRARQRFPARNTGGPWNVNSPTRPSARRSWTCRGEPEPGSSGLAPTSPASCSAPGSPTIPSHGSGMSRSPRPCNRRPTRPDRPSSSTTRSPASPTPTRAAPAPRACSTAAPSARHATTPRSAHGPPRRPTFTPRGCTTLTRPTSPARYPGSCATPPTLSAHTARTWPTARTT